MPISNITFSKMAISRITFSLFQGPTNGKTSKGKCERMNLDNVLLVSIPKECEYIFAHLTKTVEYPYSSPEPRAEYM